MNRQIISHRTELELPCRRHSVHRLELFGSAASGHEKPESDLTFLWSSRHLGGGAYANAYFGLLEALEILFARPVHLVVASAIKNPYFRQAAERTKVLLYPA